MFRNQSRLSAGACMTFFSFRFVWFVSKLLAKLEAIEATFLLLIFLCFVYWQTQLAN